MILPGGRKHCSTLRNLKESPASLAKVWDSRWRLPRLSIKDEALAQRVRNALAQDKRMGGQPIMVRVAAGEVFLKGRVDSDEVRELAALVIQGVPGVRHVRLEELEVREGQE